MDDFQNKSSLRHGVTEQISDLLVHLAPGQINLKTERFYYVTGRDSSGHNLMYMNSFKLQVALSVLRIPSAGQILCEMDATVPEMFQWGLNIGVYEKCSLNLCTAYAYINA